MANNSFDRTIENHLEKLLSSDLNQGQSQSDRTLREVVKAMMAPRASSLGDGSSFVNGFIGDGYKVRAAIAPDMTVTVVRGIGFYENPADVPANIGGVIGLDDRCSYKPMTLVASQVFDVPAAPSAGNERWDIIVAKADRRVGNPLSREIFDPGPPHAFVPDLVNKTLSFAHDGDTETVYYPAAPTQGLAYVVGIEGLIGAASIPAVTPYYTKIAEIYTKDTSTFVDSSQINDCRRMLFPGGIGHLAASFTQQTGTAVPLLPAFQGPPGVEATVEAKGPLGGLIAVKAGGRMAGLLPCAMHFFPTAWGSAVVWPGLSVQLDATSRGHLADSSKVSNVVNWGIGQWVAVWTYRLYNGASAGIGAVQANDEAGIVSADLMLTY